MVVLAVQDQRRVRHHLGFSSGAGIGAGDRAQLQEAMENMDSNYHVNVVKRILDSCDERFEITLLSPSEIVSNFSRRELIAGDLNRTVIRTTDPQEAVRWAHDTYLAATDELARQLWSPNYRQDLMMRFRYERSGGDYIRSIPGVADTAVGANLYNVQLTGGGFGIPSY
jgi:hypothetical protein